MEVEDVDFCCGCMQSLQQSLGVLAALTGFCLYSDSYSGSLPRLSIGVHGMCDGGARVETEAATLLSTSCPFWASLWKVSLLLPVCCRQAAMESQKSLASSLPASLPSAGPSAAGGLLLQVSSWRPTSSVPDQPVQASAFPGNGQMGVSLSSTADDLFLQRALCCMHHLRASLSTQAWQDKLHAPAVQTIAIARAASGVPALTDPVGADQTAAAPPLDSRSVRTALHPCLCSET